MTEEQHDPTPDESAPARYCTSQLPQHLGGPCPRCGHAAVLHVGVAHCPVCELVDLNARARSALTQQITPETLRERAAAARRTAQMQPPHRPC